jgi:hypothetical protein
VITVGGFRRKASKVGLRKERIEGLISNYLVAKVEGIYTTISSSKSSSRITLEPEAIL